MNNETDNDFCNKMWGNDRSKGLTVGELRRILVDAPDDTPICLDNTVRYVAVDEVAVLSSKETNNVTTIVIF